MPGRRHPTTIATLALLCLAFNSADSRAVDFEKDIKPLLETKCLGCHNPNIAKGDLVLSEKNLVVGAETELVVSGKPLHSDLFLAVTSDEPGGKPSMPEEGDPLTESETDLLKRWIESGAEWPDGLVLREASKADKSWWAYQPLAESKHAEIDAYLEEELAEQSLEMNPPADRRVLIRRATYDLTGLPPSPEEVAAFVADKDPTAYGKLIDRLLASPHYGERWGRHWLDVVRFGESRGFERNLIIDNAWPFRDYVIDSINADKPFDLFIREHIAGDVFGKGNPEVEIGTAFLVNGPYDDVGNQDAVQKAQIRANILDEIINATSEAFLGMTVGCARCHDHKFDPIAQTDYYRLYATFAGVRHGERELVTPEEKQAYEDKVRPLNTEKTVLEKRKGEISATIRARAKGKVDELAKNWKRPKVDRTGTEETFDSKTAKFIRLVSEGLDSNPAVAGGFRIDEFEAWTTGKNARNVALASNGATASGAARKIEDFANAYGPQLAIDGKPGARYIPTGTTLTIEFARPEKIGRVLFSSARGESTPEHRKFVFVSDYRIEVSDDGKEWEKVADGSDRKPVSDSHANFRAQKTVTTSEDVSALAEVNREIARVTKDLAAIEAPQKVWIGTRNKEDAAGPFHLFIGGSPQKKGESIVPASLSTLQEVAPEYALPPEAAEAERRRQLADWIVHPDNPLAPRVLANRIWQYHFGTGIVDTPNDFGYMGGRPTHPELLDFLAMRLKESDWRIKPLHREIMLSRAYQQSSAWRDDAGSIDGDSRLLWRFPPRRLSAEEIRDTILSVSGSLDLKMGGPGFRLYRFMQDNVCTYEPLDEHGPGTYRRAVYHQNARSSVVDLMTDFDQPDCAFSTPERSETTTPLQALTLLNHDFTLDMAETLAGRIQENAGGKTEAQVNEAFRIAFQRQPDPEEARKSITAVDDLGLQAFCRALLNANELIYLD